MFGVAVVAEPATRPPDATDDLSRSEHGVDLCREVGEEMTQRYTPALVTVGSRESPWHVARLWPAAQTCRADRLGTVRLQTDLPVDQARRGGRCLGGSQAVAVAPA